MKGKRILIALTLITSLISTAQAFPAGKTSVVVKKAGRSSSSIPNTILSGNGIPSKTIGIDGDFYIDLKNINLYGPKTKGVWKLVTSLRIADTKELVPPIAGTDGAKGNTGLTGATGSAGTPGAVGPAGAVGAAGLSGINGAAGPAGAIGPAGLKGDTGLTGGLGSSGSNGTNGTNGVDGTPGVKGDTGSAGLKGDTGLTGGVGAAGTNGTAGTNGVDGTPGAKGDTGLTGGVGAAGTNGTAGTNGVDGTPGAKGDTGLTGGVGTAGTNGTNGVDGTPGSAGAAGISNAYWVALPSVSISAATVGGMTDWINFGAAPEAGSFIYEMILDGTFSGPDPVDLAISFQVLAAGVATSFHSRVLSSDATNFINGTQGRHIQFLVMGTIASTATSSLLRFRFVDVYGTISTATLTFSGNALITKVGSIG
ncbi:MAG: hypothetical protein F2938_04085 [Actinobacteria bacterium]|uniref:Unannotated protein n=1 Tax=freshwater metagenome TaxID=449393 RepID=A0A6J6VCM2_9ZZZZ|nr:hypothetical protein [Actinomycetota bacterium]MTA60209.1 hypothetical protein [Actinomycetota bacterium]